MRKLASWLKRTWRATFIAWLVALGASVVVLAASVGLQDFITDYTETDAYNKITVGTRTVTVGNILGSHSGYVYEDFTASYFDADVRAYFTFKVTASTTGSTQRDIFALGTDVAATLASPYMNIMVGHASSPNLLYLYPPTLSGAGFSGSNYALTANTNYYVTVFRDDSVGTYGTWYVTLYADNARTNVLATFEKAATADENYQYLYAFHAKNTSGSAGISLQTSNLLLWPETIDVNNAPYRYRTATDEWIAATYNAVTVRYEYDEDGTRYYWDTTTQAWVAAGPTPAGDTLNPIETWNNWTANLSDNWKMVLAVLCGLGAFLLLVAKGAPAWLGALASVLVFAGAIVAGWFPSWVVILLAMVAGGVLLLIGSRGASE